MIYTTFFPRQLITMFVIVWCLLSTARFVNAEPVLWKVQSTNTATLFLFGSSHVANASVYPLRQAIENAYETSDILVVEVDEAQADHVKLNKLLMTRGFYPGSETIADHINIYSSRPKLVINPPHFHRIYFNSRSGCIIYF